MAGHRSHWLTEALGDEQRHDAPPLRGSAQADVAIVGGGYVGLWTALRIKELDPAADVAIPEADRTPRPAAPGRDHPAHRRTRVHTR
jgi:hypothetical protein